jgi:hypothetical protein
VVSALAARQAQYRLRRRRTGVRMAGYHPQGSVCFLNELGDNTAQLIRTR